jgi:trigger factor
MQVTQLSAEGLKREFKVTVPAGDIESRVHARLSRIAQTVKVPGFRPGKVPMALLKRQYGRTVMGEVLEEAVNEGSKRALDDGQLRPALQPRIQVTAFDEGKDLEFQMALEVLPEVPPVELESLALTRLRAEVAEETLDKAIARLLEANQSFAEPAEPRGAQAGDRLTLDFEGFVDDQPFDGGKAQGFPLVLGKGMLIPGFEEQLIGALPGSAHTVNVTFPDDYGNEALRGKPARFEVKVQKVEAPVETVLDDAFAQRFGVESAQALRQQVKDRIAQEYAQAARLKLKRQLLDQLAERCRFEVPVGMVDLEFDAIWKQLEEEMKRTGQSFGEGAESEAAMRAEYRAIAERRVRLGLVLSDIGTKNQVQVEGKELQQAVLAQARRFPGQERQVFEFYQKNPQALEQLRAPLFEDKVVDLIATRARVEERLVTPEELTREDEDEAGATAAPEAQAAS